MSQNNQESQVENHKFDLGRSVSNKEKMLKKLKLIAHMLILGSTIIALANMFMKTQFLDVVIVVCWVLRALIANKAATTKTQIKDMKSYIKIHAIELDESDLIYGQTEEERFYCSDNGERLRQIYTLMIQGVLWTFVLAVSVFLSTAIINHRSSLFHSNIAVVHCFYFFGISIINIAQLLIKITKYKTIFEKEA